MTSTTAQPPGSLPARFGTRAELAALGIYKPGTTTRVLRARSGRSDVAALASNENPLGPSRLAVEAAVAAVETASHYPDSTAERLSAALAAHLGVSEQSILTGNGADNILRTIALGLAGHGDDVVVPTPTFSAYATDSTLAGATVRVAGGETAEAIIAALTPATRVVWLASPNNPTGTALSVDDLQRIVEAAPDLATLVVDQAYWDFSADRASIDGLTLVKRGLPVIVVRTFSKAYGLAGLRIGYLVAPEPLVAELQKVREPFTLSSVAEAAAAAALADDEHLAATRDLVSRGRDDLTAALAERGLAVRASHANFVWVDLGVDAAAVADQLSYRGVAIRPGGAWRSPTFARITVGTPQQHALLLAELDRVLVGR